MKKTVRITLVGIVFNTVLFSIKLTGGILSGSLALLSDSFNSLTDILSSTAIFFAVRLGTRQADSDHPFGHHRAEPIAGLIVAILAAILGFEVLKNAFRDFFIERSLEVNIAIFTIIIASIVIKVGLYIIFRREGSRIKSPALLASSVDHRNDTLVSVSVLMGSFLGYLGYSIVDTIVAFCIGVFIIYSGFRIGVENVDFLMGKTPSPEIINRLKKLAMSVQGVKSLNEVKAHYVGNFIQVEIHIEVKKELITQESHGIAKKVQNLLQKEDIVDFAFVHVDPV